MYGETCRVEGGKGAYFATEIYRRLSSWDPLAGQSQANLFVAFSEVFAASLNPKCAFILWDFSFMKQKQ